MTILESLNRLKKGNSRFVSDLLIGQKQMGSKREFLTKEQEPFAIILSCSDSRVIPEYIFDTGLGDLFVIRIAGNVASRSSIASIEFAVSQLGAELIIVMGHQNCGAVITAIQGGDNSSNLNHLLSQITQAISSCHKDAGIDEIIMKNAELTALELVNKSTILKDSLDRGALKIIPAYYNLDTGKVNFI